ncbi:hypothetical protein EDD11_008183 [Mortierella claussenii]|nr:hypothetical protein EDD11_008183 [Mortierella claussenii]
MSKRGTENQITKDSYDRGDDDDSSSVMGTFKMASNDELAKRPMKTLRRLGSRMSSSLNDDGNKKAPSPFAPVSASLDTTPSTSAAPSSSTAPSSDASAVKSVNPFANITFGVPASISTASTPSTSAIFQSNSAFSGFSAPTPMVKKESNVSVPPNTTASLPTFGDGAFTFNVGSNAKIEPSTKDTVSSSRDSSPPPMDRETYHRTLRGVNQSFLKKIQKELEDNPIVNLALIFNQYIVHRGKVRSKYRGVDEPRTIILSPGGGDKSKRASTSETRWGSSGGIVRIGSGDSPKMTFGLPVDITGNKKSMFSVTAKDNVSPTSTPAGSATSAAGLSSMGSGALFGGGSSSMKGAVDPPKNPTASGSSWNFGSSTSVFGSPSTSSLSSSAVTTKPTDFFGFAATTGSMAGSGSTQVTPSVSAPKPFSFADTAASGSAPKPFSFQVPPAVNISSPAASSSEPQESEKMPDDTKSELQDTREGEEGEETVHEVRAKLYSIVNGDTKDLGIGQFRVNENTDTKKRRMIMRIGGTGYLILNSWVIPGMPPQRQTQKNVLAVFVIEDGKPKKYLLRVKEEQAANELFEALEAGAN